MNDNFILYGSIAIGAVAVLIILSKVITAKWYQSFWEVILKIWKDPFGSVILKAIIYGTIISILAKLLNVDEKKILSLMYYVLIALIVAFVDTLKKFKEQIQTENKAANDSIIEIATRNIEDKIFRKLVSTNAIISNRDNKLAITAKVLEDFPDESIYKDSSINKWNSESIDLVRMLSYQNLILTPKYLEYFFYRKDSVKTAKRIVVLDRDQLNGKVCQATLTYLFLSARLGYETYIIPEIRYKKFIQEKCSDKEKLKMIKGNPFMLRVEKDGASQYKGEYTDYQENIDSNGKTKDANGIENWNILDNLKNNAMKIEAKSTGFSEYIQSCVSSLNMKPIS